MAGYPELDQITAKISAGSSLSPQVNIGDKTIVGISMPVSWTVANMSFQVSADGGATFQELFTTTGAVVITTATSNLFIQIDPSAWQGVNCFKIRSGTSGTPVNQIADATVTLIVRGLI